MARKLTALQKEINADLVKVGLPAFTELEYRTDKDAIILLSMKDASYQSSLQKPDNPIEALKFTMASFYVYDEYIKKLAGRDVHTELHYQSWIGSVLKITHQPLIEQLACKEYEANWLNDTNECPYCGNKSPHQTEITEKIENWHRFCTAINFTKNFIEQTQPSWDKLSKQKKKEYIEILETMSKAELMTNSRCELLICIYFLKNYQLNQAKEAKADWLLYLNLPKIDTIEIARQVVLYSTPSKFI